MQLIPPISPHYPFVFYYQGSSSSGSSQGGSNSTGSNTFSNFHPGQFPALSGNLSTNGTSSGSIKNSSGSGLTNAGATSVSSGGSGSGSLGILPYLFYLKASHRRQLLRYGTCQADILV